ncbi:MAG TPA: DUF4214 domain-containing protein [Azospirillaceae bacterium]|nr:DUF4214 domain-containing protein [Azospirillaceae bacterium]
MAVITIHDAAGHGLDMRGTDASGWAKIPGSGDAAVDIVYDDGGTIQYVVTDGPFRNYVHVRYFVDVDEVTIRDVFYFDADYAQILDLVGVNWAAKFSDLESGIGMVQINAHNDVINGNNFDDYVRGGSGSDVLNGGGGRDTFHGDGLDDAIHGGEGLDTAVYAGTRGAYSVSVKPDGVSVHDSTAFRDGADHLTGVERLQFSDGTLALDVSGNAGQAYRLYQAAFDRTPEAAGVGFQTRAMDNGLALREVAGHFIASPEFQARYGTPATVTDRDFVTLLYENVLGRAPDAGGLAFHMGALADGYAHGDLLAFFSESPENQANVAPRIQDGIWLL